MIKDFDLTPGKKISIAGYTLSGGFLLYQFLELLKAFPGAVENASELFLETVAVLAISSILFQMILVALWLLLCGLPGLFRILGNTVDSMLEVDTDE